MSKTNVIAAPEWKLEPSLRLAIKQIIADSNLITVVLDDDPTGTQTVYNVPVLTTWGVEELEKELAQSKLFYILTNSRALPPGEAKLLAKEIGENLKIASRKINSRICVISRGDSTLRGHYPYEIDSFLDGYIEHPDLNLLIPAFLEGGRYTIDDVHYLEGEGGALIPVGETQFARDKDFGYTASNLKEWVSEKSNQTIASSYILSIGNEILAASNEKEVLSILSKATNDHIIVGNAANYQELDFLTYCLLKSGKSFLARSAASLVASISGKMPIELLDQKTLNHTTGHGGLIVIGSYVRKTTHQLRYLLEKEQINTICVSVEAIIEDHNKQYLQEIGDQLNAFLTRDEDVVLYTSREVKSGTSIDDSLEIGQMISSFLVEVVSRVSQPRFIVTKGGITSSDIATKSLLIRRAIVKGQILPGVPVWEPDGHSRFAGLPLIVFPGNVGGVEALYKAYQKLKPTK